MSGELDTVQVQGSGPVDQPLVAGVGTVSLDMTWTGVGAVASDEHEEGERSRHRHRRRDPARRHHQLHPAGRRRRLHRGMVSISGTAVRCQRESSTTLAIAQQVQSDFDSSSPGGTQSGFGGLAVLGLFVAFIVFSIVVVIRRARGRAHEERATRTEVGSFSRARNGDWAGSWAPVSALRSSQPAPRFWLVHRLTCGPWFDHAGTRKTGPFNSFFGLRN